MNAYQIHQVVETMAELELQLEDLYLAQEGIEQEIATRLERISTYRKQLRDAGVAGHYVEIDDESVLAFEGVGESFTPRYYERYTP